MLHCRVCDVKYNENEFILRFYWDIKPPDFERHVTYKAVTLVWPWLGGAVFGWFPSVTSTFFVRLRRVEK